LNHFITEESKWSESKTLLGKLKDALKALTDITEKDDEGLLVIHKVNKAYAFLDNAREKAWESDLQVEVVDQFVQVALRSRLAPEIVIEWWRRSCAKAKTKVEKVRFRQFFHFCKSALLTIGF